MYKIKVNDQFFFDVEAKEENYLVNNKATSIDICELGDAKHHVLYNNKSYETEVAEFDRANKELIIKINSKTFKVQVKDKFDELRHSMGLDNISKSQFLELKAPMPGLVLKIFVKEGEEMKKGDSLFTLEAMKMENIIKSPADAVIKAINIKPADKVERNQVLITFQP